LKVILNVSNLKREFSPMKIKDVKAWGFDAPIPVDLAGVERTLSMSVCIVEIETDEGIVGHGYTSIVEGDVVETIINNTIRPLLLDEDPMRTERLWERMYWKCSPRGQTGYASHAIAAIDVALWDIKGKVLGEPVWRLLGGARDRVRSYTTFGFGVFDREQLAEAARHWVGLGHQRLKMVVAAEALPGRDDGRPLDSVISEDVARVRAVRDAVGDDVELSIDANCRLDLGHAVKLARLLQPYGIAHFEEPITQNDVRALAQMRRMVDVPLTAGQNEGLSHRFRELLVNNAVDIVQPNVVISGGFTQCVKIAGLASAFNVPISNGGAWMHHNMHLQAGVSNGTMVEYHYLAIELCKQIFKDLPMPEAGWLTLPDAPGLGFGPDLDTIRTLHAQSQKS
jgi:L-rhamnonate dehydratase